MKPCKSHKIHAQIEDVFDAPVDSISYLMEEGFGLCVEFSDVGAVDVGKLFQTSSISLSFWERKIRHRNKALCDLVDRHGLLLLQNAFVKAKTNADVSCGMSDGRLVQDPFHRDFSTSVSVLYKEFYKARRSPTLYAPVAEVKRAIRRLDRSDLPMFVCKALNEMLSETYMFSVEAQAEHWARNVIQRDFPEFSERIYDLIPDGYKFRKNWNCGDLELAIHSNKRGGLVHARPYDDDVTEPEIDVLTVVR